MFNWLRTLLKESHAREVELLKLQNEHELEMTAARGEYEYQSSICQSCETLKLQLAEANRLIRDLTIKPVINLEEAPLERKNNSIQPGHKPWSVRRGELEAADRARAAELTKNKLAEIQPVTVDTLEEALEESLNAGNSGIPAA